MGVVLRIGGDQFSKLPVPYVGVPALRRSIQEADTSQNVDSTPMHRRVLTSEAKKAKCVVTDSGSTRNFTMRTLSRETMGWCVMLV